MGGPGVTRCLDIIRNELNTMAFAACDLRQVDKKSCWAR
jgi:L-lactate dehydrogenase (cytochrome)